MSEHPPDEARIRALLAELGSGPDGGSMPPEVAARLDDTLARLVAERDADGGGADGGGADGQGTDAAVAPEGFEADQGSVVPLRRRWTSRLTVAAAAVIVVGVGGVTAANLLGDETSLSAGGSSDRSAAQEKARGTAESDSGSAATADPSAPSSVGGVDDAGGGSGTAGSGAATALEAGTFAGDVEALLRSDPVPAPAEGRSLRSSGCPGPAITDGGVPRRITYDGRPAVLVVHPLREGRRLVEAWTCAGDRTLDRTTLSR